MTTISTNDMTNFFISKYSTASISIEDCKEYGFDVSTLENIDADKDGQLTAEEIEVDTDLYADFASIVLAEESVESDNQENEEEEKEKETQVKDKNNTGFQ